MEGVRCLCVCWLRCAVVALGLSVGDAHVRSSRVCTYVRVFEILRNVEAANDGQSRMPLWLVGDATPAADLQVMPDGLLTLEARHGSWPSLVFVIKETKPEAPKEDQEDLYATAPAAKLTRVLLQL